MRPKWGGLEGEGDSQNWGKLGDDTQKIRPKEKAEEQLPFTRIWTRVSSTYGKKSRSSCTNKRHSPDNFEAQFSVISWNMQLLLTGKRISGDPLSLPTAFGNNLRVNNAYRFRSSSKFDRHINKLSPQPVRPSSVSHCDFSVAFKATP